MYAIIEIHPYLKMTMALASKNECILYDSLATATAIFFRKNWLPQFYVENSTALANQRTNTPPHQGWSHKAVIAMIKPKAVYNARLQWNICIGKNELRDGRQPLQTAWLRKMDAPSPPPLTTPPETKGLFKPFKIILDEPNSFFWN